MILSRVWIYLILLYASFLHEILLLLISLSSYSMLLTDTVSFYWCVSCLSLIYHVLLDTQQSLTPTTPLFTFHFFHDIILILILISITATSAQNFSAIWSFLTLLLEDSRTWTVEYPKGGHGSGQTVMSEHRGESGKFGSASKSEREANNAAGVFLQKGRCVGSSGAMNYLRYCLVLRIFISFFASFLFNFVFSRHYFFPIFSNYHHLSLLLRLDKSILRNIFILLILLSFHPSPPHYFLISQSILALTY